MQLGHLQRCAAAAVVVAAVVAAPSSAAESPAAATVTSPAATVIVTEADVAHWVRVARVDEGAVPRRELERQALQLTVSFTWIEGEAAEEGVTVGDAEIRRTFDQERRQSFPKLADFRRFLRHSHQTVADIRRRVRLDLLSNRIRDRVEASAPSTVSDADIDARMRAIGPDVVPQERDIRLAHTRTRAGALRVRTRLRGLGIHRGEQHELLDEGYGTAVGRAVFRAPRGRVVGPVRGRDGYVVFEVVRIRPRHVMPVAAQRAEVRDALLADAQQKTLDDWVAAFTAKWRARTTCAPAYVWDSDCANWDGTPPGPAGRD